MTREIRDLLTRSARFLRSVSALFAVLPEPYRAAHLARKADRLAAEIAAALTREGE